MTKRCTKCKELKPLTEFAMSKCGRNGLYPSCKKCKNEYDRKRHVENIEQVHARSRRYYIEHLEKCHEKSRKRCAEHPEYFQQYRIKNKEKIHKLQGQWRINNLEKARMTSKKAMRKYRNTLKGKLNDNMSSGIYISLKRGSKANRHWEGLVGYTIDQLKKHLEKLFTPEMNWDNYGTVWEIDHRIPKAVFNFEKPGDIDFRICWSIKNLRPLEVSLNRSKHSKIENHFQPSLRLNTGVI